MNKRILLFSHDPGGCNVISSLALALRKKKYTVSLFGKEGSLKRYRKFGLVGKDIDSYVDKVSEKNIVSFLQKEKPDFIITGTSANDFAERYLWKAAEKLHIRSFAVLDQWMNYGVRFSKYKMSEMDKFNFKYDYLPSKIIVMDKWAKEEAIDDGLPKDKLLVGGQPYFDYLAKQKKHHDYRKKRKITADAFVIAFASEPISEDFKNYWGYTEKTIFAEIVQALNTLVKDLHKETIFVIKIHPRETENQYKELIYKSSIRYSQVKFIIEKDADSWDLIDSSNLVMGMSSMFLIESVIMGKPSVSVQIGLKRKNPFILSRRKILPSIENRNMLIKMLKSVIVFKKMKKCKITVSKNSCSKIIKYMEKFI